jgi:hypothetical protein
MRVLRVGLFAAMLTGCATNAAPEAVIRDTYTLPLHVRDTDRVCVEYWEQPVRRCVTAGELRAYLQGLRVEP